MTYCIFEISTSGFGPRGALISYHSGMFAFVDLSRCVIYDGGIVQLTRNRRSVGKKQHSPVFNYLYIGSSEW
jgi:hypothetical protein